MEELYKEEIEYELKDENKELILSAKSIEDILISVRFTWRFIGRTLQGCIHNKWKIYKKRTLTRGLEDGVEVIITANKKIPEATLTCENGELKIEYHK